MGYRVLNSADVRGVVRLDRSYSEVWSRKYGPGEPAALAFTDFRFTPAITVPTKCLASSALEVMSRANVGALLVERGECIVGLVTARDIKRSDRVHSPPIRDGLSRVTTPLSLTVEDLMSALDRTPSVHLDTLLMSRIGDVLATFECHREWTHILVIEYSTESLKTIRGIVSKARIQSLSRVDEVSK